jgi:GTP-binding protein YchF
LKVGIVGLPLVGKTTVFSLLTGSSLDVSTWEGKSEARVGIAQVPDPRLDRLTEIFRPLKTVCATIEYVDLPGLGTGDGQSVTRSESSRDINAYLNSLKNVDALLHVVRAFENPAVPHPQGSVDPLRDIGLFELEMMFWDLTLIERRLERLSKELKKGKNANLEIENSVLLRFQSALQNEKPLREIELTPEESKRVKGFTFLTAKPVLQLINLGDEEVDKIQHVITELGLEEYASSPHMRIAAVCGRIEAEIAALPHDDARVFMDHLGLAESALARVVQDSYALLGLVSFFTAGAPEVRAWTIRRNATAQQAAGVIHTDFEKGFIKAEVVPYRHMAELGSFQAARNKGLLRLEGRDYPVKDADVILFRFNV